MEEIIGAVGGFRAAIQDLLVPELKALQVEVRNLRATLERHEQIIAQLSKEQAERFAALQQEMDKRFAAAQRENNEKFNAVMAALHDLHKDMSEVKLRLNYGEKIHQLELRISQLTDKVGAPAAF